MSKLWIIHRNPRHRAALTRIAGRDANEIVVGEPDESRFIDLPNPVAILLGVEGDFELELEFVHRIQSRIGPCQWILLSAPEDATEAARLFDLLRPQILEMWPTARVLRAAIADAFARRRSESLALRRTRQRIADRFSAWLGDIEIPGLLRALDPSLGELPLLVRGVPGSGRALLARYVELFRSSPIHRGRTGSDRPASFGATLRIHARDIADVDELASRITSSPTLVETITTTVWIDEVDTLSISTQNALADWIVHETGPGGLGIPNPHWLATAAPSRWQDPLEPALERAFAPLVIEVPALGSEPDSLPSFANEIARDWSHTVGGADRHLSTGALAELAAQPWPGDRAEVEAILRATFASTSRDPVEAEDLRFDWMQMAIALPTPYGNDSQPELSPQVESRGETAGRPESEPAGLPIVEAVVEANAADAKSLPRLEPIDGVCEPPPVADESTLLSEASFDLAESENLDTWEELRPSSNPKGEPKEGRKEGPGTRDQTWRRLARSLSHEIRNPLVSIRTFAELLPEHYQDETFRQRFSDLVGRDVAHISDVVTRMQEVAEHGDDEAKAVDVSEMLEALLVERREHIAGQRLLVLRELEREAPMAWAEPTALRVAMAGLLDRALDSLPERGDLFVATRRIERATSGESRLRILLRHHNPRVPGDGPSHRELDELSPVANVLEYVLAETVARAHGGSLTIDTSDAKETLILLELPTPH